MTYIFNNSLQNYTHNVDTSFTSSEVSTAVELYEGTGVTYTPSSGASHVVFECNLQTSWNPDNSKSYPCTRLQYSTDSTNFVDGTWTTIAGTQMKEGSESTSADYMWFNFMWVFVISAWSGERKLRLAGRSYSTTSEFTLGRNYKASGSNGDGACPFVSIYSVMP